MDEINDLCDEIDDYQRLKSIPGFGPYIAALVLSVIGDPMRFKDRKQVLKLSGLDLNANRSGKTSNEQIPVISKNGNSDLRYALFQAAVIASRFSGIFETKYSTLVAKRVSEQSLQQNY